MLPQQLRLKDRRDFKRVYLQGKTISLPTMILYWRKSGGWDKVNPAPTRIGFSVSKKLGGAVQRNRLKRRCRAIARELLPACPPGYDMIFVGRKMATEVDYLRLRADMSRALALLKQKNTSKRRV